jgi:hypothetical protein
MPKPKQNPAKALTATDVELFERLHAQIEGLHSEMAGLVRKSPNDRLNKFKLGLVNQVLRRANELLGVSYLPFADFTEFPDEDLPSNSDVMLILNQYLAACETFRTDHIVMDTGRWVWLIDGAASEKRTAMPNKLAKKTR